MLSSIMRKLHPKRKSKGDDDLVANAHKALAMKQANEAETTPPPHQTANEGMNPAPDPKLTDPKQGADAGFTPQMKRSHVPRTGDS